MRISIFGTGYVGLVQAAVFADAGHEVLCMDKDSEKIKNLRAGRVSIYEPGLPELIFEHSMTGLLKFTDRVSEAVNHSSVSFVAVGTPSKADGSTDLNALKSLVSEIACAQRSLQYDGRHEILAKKLLIIKSTVPVALVTRCRMLWTTYLKVCRLKLRSHRILNFCKKEPLYQTAVFQTE